MTDEIYLKNSLTVNNSIITLGDTDDSGKGRHFKSRFIQPGLAGYPGQYGNALIKKENLDKFVYTLRNKPVIINHKDEIEEKDKVGEVFNVWFNPDDGWYWCDGIITDVTAQNLIKDKGWSVSCSYNFTSYNDDGGTENNVPYDIEFLDGEFMHLAIVDKPRYEGANIVMNAKDKDDKGEWITVKGTHIFIKDGQSKDEVVKEFINKQQDKSGDNKGKERNSTKDFRNHIDRIEKLIKKYNLEPHEEDELLDELGSFEAKLDENLEPRQEEELREKLFDFEDDIKRNQEMKKNEKEASETEDKSSDSKKNDDYKREADIALTMMAHDYEKRGNKGTVERANELKEKLKKGEELTERDKAHIKTALDTYKPKEHTEEAKLRQKKMDELHETLKSIAHKNEKDNQSISYVPIDAVPYGKTHTQYWGVDETGKTQYTTEDKQKIYGVGLYKDYDGKEKLGFYIDYSDKPHWEVKKEPKNLLSYYGESNAMTPEQFDDVYQKVLKQVKKYKANNSKGDLMMSVLNELESFVKGVIRNANDEDEKEIKNEKVDKRELIEEVGGMLKGKVDDEIIRTIIKKMEEASYDESEAGSADNKKVKNESEEEKEDKKAENKKVKNEESEDDKEKAEELKKEDKEDVENKCNNSKTDFFDRMNKIYNSTLTPDKSETEYASRADRLKAGEEYFKI